ncbi:oxygen-dependent coproporphyrinogen oxidase [Alphaproteobacteria bacterium]|nr:oxygen-dependent coproporphyrinogen oxidase [Alphaproteobacteria bacterium]
MTIKADMIENLKQLEFLDNDQLLNSKKKIAINWFADLRDKMCKSFEGIEKNKLTNSKKAGFTKKKWLRDGGGGGVTSIMYGQVFEKVGVNISTVHGEFSKEFREQIPGAEEDGKFWASGISVVSHMTNPHVPAAHMNTRLLITGDGDNKKIWFGGGGDLTPVFEDLEVENLFHSKFKIICDKYDSSYYPKFKSWCDDYFYLPHRKEARGIGGIFFDYLNNNDWDKDFSFVKDVGKTFLSSYLLIINKRLDKKFSKQERMQQLLKRGRYVEFNLLYDRGTIFGLKTGGNEEAILMSLPPKVTWV